MVLRTSSILPSGILLLLGLLAAASLHADDLPQRLRLLVEQQDFAAAYELGAAGGHDYTGETEFDFYFALAALGNQRPDEAVLALDRVLLSEPDNERARLELGRAYLALAEYANAKRTFEQVLAAKPPANVRARVELLLGVIEKQLAATRWHRGIWASAVAGYDSNVNAATHADSVAVPALGGSVILDPSSREIEDGFREVIAAGELKYRFNQQLLGFGTLSVRDRNNFDTDTFDVLTTTAQLGAEKKAGIDRWKFPVTFDGLWLDGLHYRDMVSAGLEWNREYPGRFAPMASLQAGTTNYPTQADRDAFFWTVGAGLTQNLARRRYALTFHVGGENADDGVGKHNGRQHGGVRLVGQWNLWQQLTLAAQLGSQRSEYNAPDPVFSRVRHDTLIQGALGLAWHSTPQLSWRLDGSFLANDSNLELYEYRRTVISGSVSYAL